MPLSINLYQLRKEAGLCVLCGHDLDDEQMRCSSCRERLQDWRKKNKDRLREIDKRYYERNKELVASKKKLYYEKNKEKIWGIKPKEAQQ